MHQDQKPAQFIPAEEYITLTGITQSLLELNFLKYRENELLIEMRHSRLGLTADDQHQKEITDGLLAINWMTYSQKATLIEMIHLYNLIQIKNHAFEFLLPPLSFFNSSHLQLSSSGPTNSTTSSSSSSLPIYSNYNRSQNSNIENKKHKIVENPSIPRRTPNKRTKIEKPAFFSSTGAGSVIKHPSSNVQINTLIDKNTENEKRSITPKRVR